MREPTNHIVLGLTLIFCLLNVYVGWVAGNVYLAAGGALGFSWLALRMAYAVRRWHAQPANPAP